MAAEPQRARPKATPETKHFWDGVAAGELRLQRCNKCSKAYFPPRPFCPECGHREVTVFKASGKGFLYSYIIHHRPAPGFTPPYSIAVVELEEGPRMKGRTRNDMRRDIPGDTFSDAELFEVFYYYGDMTPDDMVLLGLDQGMEEGKSNLTDKDWRLQNVPAVVTMLNGRCR